MIKKILFTTFILLSTQTLAKNLPLYSCDSCNSAKSVSLAKELAPPLQCHSNTKPGEITEIGDEVCYATNKILFIANPLTKQAYKYQVDSDTNGYNKVITVHPLTISADEQELIDAFYKIDAQYRKAANTMVDVGVNASLSISTLSNQASATSDNHFFNLSNETASSDSCRSHPTNYFTPRGEHKVEERLNAEIANKIGNADWTESWQDTTISGLGLTIGRGTFGIDVKFTKNTTGVFATMLYGSRHNLLNFEVTYHGDYYLDGVRNLNLSFKLLRGSSSIDGIRLKTLFPESGGSLDLSHTGVTNCLLDYIESIAVKIEYNNPSSGQPGGTPGGGGGASGGFCTRTVHTRAGNRNQVFIFASPCQ
ncbi:hypothetical protein GCM10009111_27380 [Colwellia asteriadis]|uniref:Uncharacterized protein n=1 Tax=Colwellia asteriadis TaxID=517723 RepID=A0ABN1L9I3_9GAMM